MDGGEGEGEGEKRTRKETTTTTTTTSKDTTTTAHIMGHESNPNPVANATPSTNTNNTGSIPTESETLPLGRAGSIGLGRLPSFDMEGLLGISGDDHLHQESLTAGDSAIAGGISMSGISGISGLSSGGGSLLKMPSLPSMGPGSGGGGGGGDQGGGGLGLHSQSMKHVHFDIADLTPTPLSEDLIMDAGAAGAGSEGGEGGVLRAPSLDMATLSKLESQPSFQKLASFHKMPSFSKMPPSLARMDSLQRMGSLTRMGSMGNALQSAKSGDFLEFLNEITDAQLKQLEEGEGLEDDLSQPPTPTTPMDTPRGASPRGAGLGFDVGPGTPGVSAGGPAAAAAADLSAQGMANNPDNDLFLVNEEVFVEAMDTTKVNGETLRTYFLSEERAGDILFFRKDALPWFEKEKIRRDGRDKKDKKGGGGGLGGEEGSLKKARTVTRMSDKQLECICGLRPQLMFPKEGKGSKGWKRLDTQGPTCKIVRGTPAAKKQLENYKYTGLCKDHVDGKGAGSRQSWLEHKRCTVRGFNLERNVNDRRMRHLLCLETEAGLVFLKWCTQCHLWKNFAGFTERGKGPKSELHVHTFCSVCHQRQVLSRDKRRMERAKKRKLAEMNKKATKDAEMEDVAEKINLKRQNTMDRAWIKSFALESTASKFSKFSKTIFENMDEKPIICGVFADTAEDIIVIKAMEVMLELQTNPTKSPQVFGEGRWVQVMQEILENDLEPALAQYSHGAGGQPGAGGGGGGNLERQTSLEFWGKPNKREMVRRKIEELMQVDEVRYKIILLGSLLVEERLSKLLERDVKLEAMYEGCILMAFTCDLLPNETEHKLMQLTPQQMFGLHKMGWSGLHYKCGDRVMPLVEGPGKNNAEPIVEIVEMLGVKLLPSQILQKNASVLLSLYPQAHIHVFQRNFQGLAEQCAKSADHMNAKPAEVIDWQGCTALHHAVVHATAGDDQLISTLLYHGADVTKQNRRGFTPLEVASLTWPNLLPILVNHYLGQGHQPPGGNIIKKEGVPEREEKMKVLRKLIKTLESSSQHVKNDLVKRQAQAALGVLRNFCKDIL